MCRGVVLAITEAVLGLAVRLVLTGVGARAGVGAMARAAAMGPTAVPFPRCLAAWQLYLHRVLEPCLSAGPTLCPGAAATGTGQTGDAGLQ